MYVCNCNAITDKQAEQAICDGCTSPADIYARCGTQPKCGRCKVRLAHMLDDMVAASHPGELLAAE